MINTFALDTNVLIYLHDTTVPLKTSIAEDLLSDRPKISAQVVSEYLNTCRRIFTLDKYELLLRTSELLSECPIIPITTDTLQYAADLSLRYKFQLFDAIIVAASIEGNCDVLYSEDMQHRLIVDKRLTIINPFI